MRTTIAAALCCLFATTALAAESVNVNTATRDQLEALPGIGAKIADAIVRDRDENGPFSSVEDLTRVPGVTPSLLGKLKGSLTTDGGGGGGGGSTLVIEEGKNIGSDVVRKVLARFAAEPSVREVQQQAIEYARVHPDVVDSWRWRSRTRGLAPEVTLDGDVKKDDGTRDVTNLDASTAPIHSVDDDLSLSAGVTAKWRLDRFVYEPYESNVARETVRMAQLRDRVLDDVTRRYYERRRLQIDLELAPPTELADRVRKELRLQELTADIDASTGGWFSEKLASAGRSPY